MKTTKTIFVSLCAVLLSISVSAQNYDLGDMNANAGMAVFSSFTGDTKLPPAMISFELGTGYNIATGVFGGISTSQENINLNNGKSYSWDHQNLFFGVRAMYYAYSSADINFYLGSLAGYNSVTSEFSSDDIDESNVNSSEAGGIFHSIFAGSRYFFSDPWGVYAEAGIGKINFQLGITAKF